MGTRLHPLIHSNDAASNLVYHNGPVMTGVMQAYAIFWEPTGSHVSPTYNSLIQRYFRDVGSSDLYQNNTQYKDAQGNAPSSAVLAGSWIDTAPYPSSTLTDQQIRNEVTHAMNVNGWTQNITHAFFVFTAKDEQICSGNQCSFTSFCSYHSFFNTHTIYAVLPYAGTNLSICGVPSSPNSDIDADSMINLASHEQMETATDPLITGWYDSSGAEEADKCTWKFGTTTNGGDVVWNNHPYIVQKEWDNAKSACVLAGP
jgi:hypothetical protein